MRRLIVISAFALAGGLISASAVLAAAAAQPPRSRLRSFVCQTALDPAARGMSVTAVMRPLLGTAKMEMRFELLRRRRRGARPVSVSGHDLNRWITPTDPSTLGQRPGDVWVVRHPVVDLGAPDLYRFRVTFRWTDASGSVLGTISRVSQICAQPELRPDLAVPAVTVFALAAGWDRYRVVVRNDGRTAAGPFGVQLAIGQPLNEQVFAQQVDQLEPHSQVALQFRAPACTAGEPLMATADPSDAVDDPNRANNTLATSCPSGLVAGFLRNRPLSAAR